MNKLNSKNPILRFKLIIKAKGGLVVSNAKNLEQTKGGYKRLSIHGNPNNEDSIIYRWFDKSGNQIKNEVLDGDYILKTDGTKVHKSRRSPEELKKFLNNSDSKSPVELNIKPGTKPKTTISKPNYAQNFNNFTNNLTANLRAYLDSKMGAGKSIYNANDVLEFLLNQGATNLGTSGVNKNGVDGLWGDRSIKAWNNFLAQHQGEINNMLNTAYFKPELETSKPQSWFTPLIAQTIPSTTNFGYRTDNTYEGSDFSDRLKGLGIGSNADLINWMHNTGANNYDWKGNTWARQFRSDVNQALGGDYSDANIRKTFNIGGNWGRGFLGGGDISDFQRALQTNAGVWNGRYDLKRDNFIKSQPMLNLINNYFANGSIPYSDLRNNLAASKNFVFDRGNLFKAEKGGQLISNNPVKRFKFLNGGEVTTLKTSIPKHLFGSILLNNDFKLRNQLKQLFVDKPVELVKLITKPMEKSTEKAAKKNKNIAALLLQLWNSGAFNGVIDERTGKLVTYERAVDGISGRMTNEAKANYKKYRESLPLSPKSLQVKLTNTELKKAYISLPLDELAFLNNNIGYGDSNLGNGYSKRAMTIAYRGPMEDARKLGYKHYMDSNTGEIFKVDYSIAPEDSINPRTIASALMKKYGITLELALDKSLLHKFLYEHAPSNGYNIPMMIEGIIRDDVPIADSKTGKAILGERNRKTSEAIEHAIGSIYKKLTGSNKLIDLANNSASYNRNLTKKREDLRNLLMGYPIKNGTIEVAPLDSSIIPGRSFKNGYAFRFVDKSPLNYVSNLNLNKEQYKHIDNANNMGHHDAYRNENGNNAYLDYWDINPLTIIPGVKEFSQFLHPEGMMGKGFDLYDDDVK